MKTRTFVTPADPAGAPVDAPVGAPVGAPVDAAVVVCGEVGVLLLGAVEVGAADGVVGDAERVGDGGPADASELPEPPHAARAPSRPPTPASARSRGTRATTGRIHRRYPTALESRPWI
jgi:hypothetical protein